MWCHHCSGVILDECQEDAKHRVFHLDCFQEFYECPTCMEAMTEVDLGEWQCLACLADEDPAELGDRRYQEEKDDQLRTLIDGQTG